MNVSVNILIIVFWLCLHCVTGRLIVKRGMTTTNPPTTFYRRKLSYVTLPDKDFCRFMKKNTAGSSLVLPWWKYYCNTILALNLTLVICKRYKDSSSEESIENVLYYQDCNHKRDKPLPVPMRALDPPTTKKPQECKMCCSMCCGEECQQTGSCNQPKPQIRQLHFNPIQKIEPARQTRPRIQNPNPFFARREFGLTKENIKSLISQDIDIRKILKDLVRVTLQKVDLMKLLNAKNKPANKENEYENDL